MTAGPLYKVTQTVHLSGNENLNKRSWVRGEKLGKMKLFAGRPGECSIIALRPLEMPDRRDWIIWSPARTVDVEPDRRHFCVPPLRWPSVPDFPGQSLFLTSSPGKNQRSPGTPICPVFGLASRICPDFTCARWKCEHVAVDKRWVELFTHFHQQDISCANVFKMVEFCLSLPGPGVTGIPRQYWLHCEKHSNYSNKFWYFLSRLQNIAGNASAVAQSNPFQRECLPKPTV